MRGVSRGLALCLLVGLVGCQEEVTVAPTADDFARERERVAQERARRKANGAPAQRKPRAEQQAAADPEDGFAKVAEGYSYDPTGKRDPFRPFHWTRVALDDDPRGPLEQFDLAQLSVIALVWDDNRSRALIQDPSGASYVVREGTPIGKNEGRVVHIGDNMVVVKETYEDYAGNQTTKDVELRVRRSEGG
ncbi:MAG: pilus assembly protein PilP [Proteobacteria bacterium]|nr:pilus assembly protein PilP [Pseudomonadota bacterium]